MASAITVKVGQISATRTFADDAKVQEVLLKFSSPPDELGNKEKLEYALDRIVDGIVAQARQTRRRELEAAAIETAASEIKLE